jgi:glutaredoxin
LKAWAESLGGISYPLLSDFFPHGQVAQTFGVLRPEGYTERAIFVIDKQGVIRYVDVHDIDEQPDNEVLFAVLAELEPEAARQAAVVSSPAAAQPAPTADVILYCTPWCPDCRRARAFLKERGVPFVEVDISRDREAARKVREWGNGAEITPTISIQGKIIQNYSPGKLETALKSLHQTG